MGLAKIQKPIEKINDSNYSQPKSITFFEFI